MEVANTVMAVGDALVIISAAIATTSVVVHATVKPRWWTSPVARHLMAYMAVVAAVLDLSAIRVIAGAGLDTEWFVITRIAVFAGVPFVLAWRLTLQVQLSRWIHHQAAMPDALARDGAQHPEDGGD